MKRKGFAAAAAVLLLLAGVWWWTGPRQALDGPPGLSVSAGGKTTEVKCWGANWASPNATYNACGDAPTAPAARANQPVIYVTEGTEALTLSYPVAPSQVTVRITPDSGEPGAVLYEGSGKQELSIPLPEDFRGIYEVSEVWNNVPPATGDAQRGFLVVGQGESPGDPKLAEPPELMVTDLEGNQVSAQRGSYAWYIWQGGEEIEGIIADAPHPLEMTDLPVLAARPGDRLKLQFTIPPDEVSVWAWPVEKGIEQEPAQAEMFLGNELPLPETDGPTVYEVRGSWRLVGETSGEVSYVILVP